MESAFNELLLICDESGPAKVALQKTCDIASTFGSNITAIFMSGQGDTSKKFLTDFASSKGVGLEIADQKGNPIDLLKKMQKTKQIDLVVFGIEGLKGSKAYKYVKHSDCPVITINDPNATANFDHFLMPMADYQSTRQKARFAVIFAKAFNATVHILGVTKSGKASAHKRIDAYIRQTERFLAERGIRHTVDYKYGLDVPSTCLDYAKEVNAGMMLIMADSESVGLFGKPYAQRIIEITPMPVLCMNSKSTQIQGASGY